jgi:hypothetical protein
VAARGASAARDGFGFARNTTTAATTFDVFCWLEVTNFDVPLFDPSPNGLDYIDVWDFWIHAKNALAIISFALDSNGRTIWIVGRPSRRTLETINSS